MPDAPTLSHLQWRAPEWLMAFGPLTPHNVMDYFAQSPFFDRTSNNAVLRMQHMYSGGMEGVDEEAELRRFVGTEYVLGRHDTDLFVILKRHRTSPSTAAVQGAFYVLNDNVYEAPSLYTVLNERVLTAVDALGSALTTLAEKKPLWSAVEGAQWKVEEPKAEAGAVLTAPAFGAASAPSAGSPSGAGPENEVGKATAEGSAAASAAEALAAAAAVAEAEIPEKDAAMVSEVPVTTARETPDTPKPAPNTFNTGLFRALQTTIAQNPLFQTPQLSESKGEANAGEGGNLQDDSVVIKTEVVSPAHL